MRLTCFVDTTSDCVVVIRGGLAIGEGGGGQFESRKEASQLRRNAVRLSAQAAVLQVDRLVEKVLRGSYCNRP